MGAGENVETGNVAQGQLQDWFIQGLNRLDFIEKVSGGQGGAVGCEKGSKIGITWENSGGHVECFWQA